jgi:glycosyltransferase 2 family protein
MPATTLPGARQRPWLRLLRPLGWGVGLIALGLIVRQLLTSVAELGELTITPATFVAALVLGCASLWGYAWLWWRNLIQLGEQLALPTAVRIWFLSQLVRYIPGNVWHLFGRAYMAQQVGVRGQPLTLSLGLELFQTITAALLLASLMLPFWTMPIWAQPWLLLALPGIGVYCYPQLLLWPLSWLKRWGGATATAQLQLRRRDLLSLLPGYLLTWLLYGCGLYLLARALYPLPIQTLPGIIASFAVAWVIGFMSFITPSGLGVREGVLGLLLATLMPQPIALLLALVARVWLTLAELCTLALALLWNARAGRIEQETK